VTLAEHGVMPGNLVLLTARLTPAYLLTWLVILILGYRTTPTSFRILTPWPTCGQSGIGWIPMQEGLFDDAASINAYEAMPTNADSR
jgi:hypothetical protein